MKTTTCNYGVNAGQPKKDYKAEGDEFIEKLKDEDSGAKYCHEFFFDTEVTDANGRKKKLSQIAPLRSKMIYDLKKDFNVDVKPEDFSTVVYQAVWAEGSFRPLDSYEGRSSFFCWLKTVARNAVMDWLVDEHLINDVCSRTVGNTRLALLSQSRSKCKLIIDDLMAGSKYHGLLTAIYVDKLPVEKIMKQLHIEDAAEYEATKKAGVNRLKDALLRSVEYSEENLIRDKKKKKEVDTVSYESVADLSKWEKEMTGENPLSDVFGTDLTDEEVRENTSAFLYDFSGKMNWSERDRYIWCRRFIINADAEDLAVEVGHDRAWLDTRYSRLNAMFRKAIKGWWKTHAV